MTQTQCSHCGKPLYTGFLCSDCQALRAYQPDLFASAGRGGTRGGFQIDRTAVLSVAGLLAIFALAIIFVPQMQQATRKSHVQATDPTASIVDKFKKALDIEGTSRALSGGESSSTPSAGLVAYNQSTANVTPGYLQSVQVPRVSQTVSAENEFHPAGNYTAQAQNTLNEFLATYCGERQIVTGKSISVTNVMWLPSGTGAVVALDEAGNFRQGTVQYSPSNGWAWIVTP